MLKSVLEDIPYHTFTQNMTSGAHRFRKTLLRFPDQHPKHPSTQIILFFFSIAYISEITSRCFWVCFDFQWFIFLPSIKGRFLQIFNYLKNQNCLKRNFILNDKKRRDGSPLEYS
jgi:hypothetical protein